MKKWNELSMADKAKYIKLGVDRGITDLDYIKNTYHSYVSDDSLNKYDGGGWLNKILGWFKSDQEEEKEEREEERRKSQPQLMKELATSNRIKRIRENDTPSTKEYSERLENNVAALQNKALQIEKRHGHNSEPYYIPYIEDQEIKVPGKGRVSKNALDSIAVNTVKAGIPLYQGLGLFSHETVLGASPNLSANAYKKSHPNATAEEIHNFETAAHNASFMRNFGGIHPQFAVNDHEWTNRGWEESPKYGPKLKDIQSPLQHAFTMFDLGIYNTGDEDHKPKVEREGRRLMSLPVIQEWIKESPYAQEALKIKDK